MELTWALDYCLACDKQTSGGAYCSQTCRLADHESSSRWSTPSSPTSSTASNTSKSAVGNTRGSGFYLSPAINFDEYRTAAWASSSTQSTQSSNRTPSQGPSKALSSSSSRSSLTSNASNSTLAQDTLPERIHNELRAYTNSFDTTRNWRRRMTWS